ncbi:MULTISPECIES: hypothetical protein [Clostridia]|nr:MULTISPECIES: hypothetical protein [Clostridia]
MDKIRIYEGKIQGAATERLQRCFMAERYRVSALVPTGVNTTVVIG